MDLLTLPYTSKSTGEFLTASWMANNTGPKTQCSFGQLLVVLFQYRGNRVEHMGISSLYSLHPTQLITPHLQHHLSLQMGFFSYSACKEQFPVYPSWFKFPPHPPSPSNLGYLISLERAEKHIHCEWSCCILPLSVRRMSTDHDFL
ncbi:hypothetical protein KIL84_003840 [Mauremys mutica]|uniref:Uncharacterized protein n=1 Tax=Mauremys mutica TaxID=74926 RepID=A0A9D4AMY5_9SAUR|nr:hypothetical protein KIL84_003840 [Mauremys mutica]